MQSGEIMLGYFPFGDITGAKLRPLLLLTGPIGTGTEVIAAYISSVIPATLLASDILLDTAQPFCQSTRLKVVSVLRLHKIATVHTSVLQRYIGFAGSVLRQEVEAKMKIVLKL